MRKIHCVHGYEAYCGKVKAKFAARMRMDKNEVTCKKCLKKIIKVYSETNHPQTAIEALGKLDSIRIMEHAISFAKFKAGLTTIRA